MSDYHNEFEKIYDYFTYKGEQRDIRIKNMYNVESYFS